MIVVNIFLRKKKNKCKEQMSYHNERKLSLLSLAAASFYSSFWPIEVAKNKSPLLPFLRIAVITACLDGSKLMTRHTLLCLQITQSKMNRTIASLACPDKHKKSKICWEAYLLRIFTKFLCLPAFA